MFPNIRELILEDVEITAELAAALCARLEVVYLKTSLAYFLKACENLTFENVRILHVSITALWDETNLVKLIELFPRALRYKMFHLKS